MIRSAAKAAVVFNAHAGRGRGTLAATQAARHLARSGWQTTRPVPTPASADARRGLVEKLARRADLLVVVGGDGTLRETGAALYLQRSRIAIGFIPIGNSNVLARELGIPRDPPQAVHLLTTGHAQDVDAAHIKSRDDALAPQFFMAMLDIGFGAAVIHRVHRWRNRWPGTYRFGGDLLYLLAGITALQGPPRPVFQITIDDQIAFTNHRLAVIANTRTYAKGWSLTPQAAPTDGVLDVFGRQRDDPAAIMHTFFNAWRRRINKRTDAHYHRGHQLVIKAEHPLCLQADGDPLTPQTRLRVEALPAALRILVPDAAQ